MKTVCFIFLVGAFIFTTSFVVKKIFPPQALPVKGYKLVWNDEFNGQKLDLQKWNYRGIGKRDDAFITESAIKLNGKGCLVIEVRQQGDSVITGMIGTENTFSTRYGYFECRAMLTKASGIYPSFWLQSPLINTVNGTPGTSGAEIDIFEYEPHNKKNAVAHTLHYGGYGPTHKVAGPVWGALQKTKDNFHVFGLEWTPEGYTTFVDGLQTFSGSTLVSKVPEFVILSAGVSKAAAGPLSLDDLPDQFSIDYVRVYKKQ